MIVKTLTFSTEQNTQQYPLALTGVACGFPSPADDHLDAELNLSDYLIKHPAATIFARADGDSLKGLGITHGDLLVIDRSARPRQNDVVVVAIDGQLVCKILDIRHQQLLSANTDYPAIPIDSDNMDVIIEGVVMHAVHHLRGRP